MLRPIGVRGRRFRSRTLHHAREGKESKRNPGSHEHRSPIFGGVMSTFSGKAAGRSLRAPFRDSASESASSTQISSTPVFGANEPAPDRVSRLDSLSTAHPEHPLVDPARLARPHAAANGIARPETGATIKQVWQSPHMREIAMSSDLAMHAAAKILHAQGCHSQALDVAKAILAAQEARPSPGPMQPDIATSRALVAEILHSLRSEDREKA